MLTGSQSCGAERMESRWRAKHAELVRVQKTVRDIEALETECDGLVVSLARIAARAEAAEAEISRLLECNRAAERVIIGCNEEIERLRNLVPLAEALDGLRCHFDGTVKDAKD